MNSGSHTAEWSCHGLTYFGKNNRAASSKHIYDLYFHWPTNSILCFYTVNRTRTDRYLWFMACTVCLKMEWKASPWWHLQIERMCITYGDMRHLSHCSQNGSPSLHSFCSSITTSLVAFFPVLSLAPLFCEVYFLFLIIIFFGCVAGHPCP